MSRLISIMITIAITAALHAEFIQPGSGSGTIKYNNLSEEATTPSSNNDKFPDICLNIKVQIFDAEQNVVKISWTPPSNEDTLILARSSSIPISNREIFLNADKSVEIQASRSSYLDRGLQPGSYYYAILSKRKSKTNQALLYSEENYNSHPIVISKFKKKINNEHKQTPSRYESGTNTTKKSIGFLPKQIDGRIGSNTTTTNSNGQVSKKGEFFYAISAQLRTNSVLVNWQTTGQIRDFIAKGRAPSAKIQVYRFIQRPTHISDLKYGSLIGKVGIDQTHYVDIPNADGTFYYAVFLENGSGLQPGKLILYTNLVGPIHFKFQNRYEEPSLVDLRANGLSLEAQNRYEEPSLVDYDRIQPKKVEKNKFQPIDIPVDINGIIRSTYLKGNYHQTITSLQNYKRSPNEKVRAKALFYTGLSYYKLRNYDEAIQYFVNPLVMRAYKKSANFWYKRTLGKIR